MYREELRDLVLDRDDAVPESSLLLPDADDYIKGIRSASDALRTDTLTYVAVVGIGGSSLGTQAVYTALRGTEDSYRETYPKLLFCDTVSSMRVDSIAATLADHTDSKDEVAIIVVSKSGTTTETIANFEILHQRVSEEYGDITDRIAVISDARSPLSDAAQDRDILTLTVPAAVGGRFSVLSAVGLLPLSLAGIDIEGLCSGAKEMRDRCLVEEDENPAIVSACTAYTQYKSGNRVHNMFLFAPELESFGKWYRQLTAESLGKRTDIDGTEVHAGIIPTVSIGSTDLHSMAQLYFGGPRDIFTTLVSVDASGYDVHVPESLIFGQLVDDIAGKTTDEIMNAVYRGVRRTYRAQELPFVEISLDAVDAYTLGAVLQMKMCEVMYLGKLMHVNVFNQPAVEQYKQESRKMLKNHP